MLKCPNGHENEDDSVFCEDCGMKVENPNEAQAEPPATPAAPAAPAVPDQTTAAPPAATPPETTDPPSTSGPEIKCPKCGEINDDEGAFCEGCGHRLKEPEIVCRLYNKKNNEFIEFKESDRDFGRSDFLHWVPEEETEPHISRAHFKIWKDADEFKIKLLQKQINVTKLNGTKMDPEQSEYTISDNDIIDISKGRIVLRFETMTR